MNGYCSRNVENLSTEDSRKSVHQNVNEGEEDGSWNEDIKRMHRLVLTLCV